MIFTGKKAEEKFKEIFGTDKDWEQLIDEGYEKCDQQEFNERQLGLINYGDETYYFKHKEEFEKDWKIAELEEKVLRLKDQLKAVVNRIDLLTHDKDYRFLNYDGTWYSRESCQNLSFDAMFYEIDKELNDIEINLEKKRNAIIPKFKIGQKVYKINGHYDDDFNYKYTIEKFTIENIHYHFKCDIENISYDLSGGWKCIGEQDLFATEEEAEEELKKLKGK